MAARKFLLFSLVLLLSFNAFAQDSDDALKKKRERELKLLEQILAEAKNLRLPENRAIVFARAGNALWQTDEKRARKLFSDAIAETINAQLDVQNERGNKQYFQNLIYGQTPRIDIINLIGSRDPELALEFLAKSRPPAIAEAMQNSENNPGSMIQQFVRNEITAEQRLIGLAAEQNPQAAVKRVRESIKKGVSYETLNLLRKIYAKDPQTADELAAELAESFLSINVSKNYQTAETVGYFIAEMGRPRTADEKALRISDDLLRRLVVKMTDEWLNPNNPQPYGYWNCLAVIEKLFPERAVQIKKRISNSNNQNQIESERYSKLVSGETAPEEMLAHAEKFQSGYRNEIYRNAAMKFANGGNIAQAEKILQTNISDGQAPYFLAQFYVNLSNQLAGQGRFDEANAYISRIEDENQRIDALISLANSAYQRNPQENQKLAEGILNQARALLTDAPETQADFNAAAALISAYAPFDSDESFRLLELLQPMLNELIQANFVLMKFRSYGGVRQGELQLMNANSLGFYNLENSLRVLKDKDFERALQFTNGFNRSESRIWLQLQLINDNIQNIVNLPINTRFVKSGG